MNTDQAPLDIEAQLRGGRRAGKALAQLPGPARRELLEAMAERLQQAEALEAIMTANARDMARGRELEAKGELSAALVARLELSETKIAGLVAGLRDLAAAPELVGQRDVHRKLDEGLILERQRWPLGQLGIVFEARPDAVVQIVGLAVKSGNAVALKGGREASESNRALVDCLHRSIAAAPQGLGLSTAAITLLDSRDAFARLLEMEQLVDLIIARGSSQFVRMIQGASKIPVMGHAEGICHIYLHSDADPSMSARICVDAKCSYPAACNSVETLLWHHEAGGALDTSLQQLAEAGVRLRGCERTRARAERLALAVTMEATDESDWATEWSDKVLSIRCVDHADQALEHIEHHGSGHTEVIVTQDQAMAEKFLEEIDAACIFHNASTRFSDGFRFGLGAEVGISTGKLHDRGPVGVEGLLTHRWRMRGAGQITSEYGAGKRRFLHTEIPLK